MARALIPNSTQIPDVILDQWMAELSGAEFKVLLYIARRTYGFGKDSDRVSLSQIAQGITRRDGTVLDRGTGVSRASVARALKALEDLGVVARTTNLSATGREFEENTYRINLDWQPRHGGGTAEPEGQAGGGGVVSKRDHLASPSPRGWSQNQTGVVSKRDTQETEFQETVQETAAQGP
jgi:phage replication O-like protein O